MKSASVTNNSNYTTTLFHETEALVSVKNNQAVTSSLQVAEYFGKRHANILRDIQNLILLNSKLSSGYVSTTYIDPNGKSQPMYIMTRDGFTLLAMGFTGKKAMQFKIAYIEAFNRMEELLKKNQATKYAEKLFKKQIECFNAIMKKAIKNGKKRHGEAYGGLGDMLPWLPYYDNMSLEENMKNVFAFISSSYGESMYFISQLSKKEKELTDIKRLLSRLSYEIDSKLGIY